MGDRSTDATADGPRFELEGTEAILHGVHVDDGVLRFGPSGAQSIQAWLFLTIGVVLGVAIAISGVTTGSPVTIVAGSAMLIAAATAGLSLLRPRVTADRDGVHIRTLMRSTTIEWNDIRDITANDTPPRRWAGRIGTNGLTLRKTAVNAWTNGNVELNDGTTVGLPTFVSAARGEGLNMGGPTAVEQRAAILNRYRLSVDRSPAS